LTGELLRHSFSNSKFDIDRHYVSDSSASEYTDAHDDFQIIRADTGSGFFNRKLRVSQSRDNTSSYFSANENTVVGNLQKSDYKAEVELNNFPTHS